jgi:hypothetical protein
MPAPWFCCNTSVAAPQIVPVVGVIVWAPAPVFTMLMKLPATKDALGRLGALAVPSEKLTSLPQSLARKV